MVLTRSLRASLSIVDNAPRILRALPDIGRPMKGERDALLKRIIERLGDGQPRELIAGELLVLYLSGSTRISLLAVRHQKQSGYSFN